MLFHETRLLERERVAHETLAIRVERPRDFIFHAGQYVDITVPGLAERDALGPIRSMSMASAPEADHLEFVMRLRDTAFKRALATMPIGTDLLLEGPIDDLEFGRGADRQRVFIAGGVGIAPFLSLLRGAVATDCAIEATLFYSNRRPEDAAYLDELYGIERQVRGFHMVPTMTRMEDSARGWSGETDRLGRELLQRHLLDLVGPAYFIVGGPALISHVRMVLRSAGVADEDISVELYVGY